MAPEIVRKLVGGKWRTVEQNGSPNGGPQTVGLRGPCGPFTETAIHDAWDTDHADITDLAELADGEVILGAWSQETAAWNSDAGQGYGYFGADPTYYLENQGPVQLQSVISSPPNPSVSLIWSPGLGTYLEPAVGTQSLSLRFFSDPGPDGTGATVFFLLIGKPVAP